MSTDHNDDTPPDFKEIGGSSVPGRYETIYDCELGTVGPNGFTPHPSGKKFTMRGFVCSVKDLIESLEHNVEPPGEEKPC